MCDSNVGNLSIKLKKYDKAIFHLSDSILLIRSKEKISNEDLIYNKNKMKSHRLTSRTCNIFFLFSNFPKCKYSK